MMLHVIESEVIADVVVKRAHVEHVHERHRLVRRSSAHSVLALGAASDDAMRGAVAE